MELQKAIEILTQHQKGTDPFYLTDLSIAEKLGIEALGSIIAWRDDNDDDFLWDLLGETPE